MEKKTKGILVVGGAAATILFLMTRDDAAGFGGGFGGGAYGEGVGAVGEGIAAAVGVTTGEAKVLGAFEPAPDIPSKKVASTQELLNIATGLKQRKVKSSIKPASFTKTPTTYKSMVDLASGVSFLERSRTQPSRGVYTTMADRASGVSFLRRSIGPAAIDRGVSKKTVTTEPTGMAPYGSIGTMRTTRKPEGKVKRKGSTYPPGW